MRIVVDEIPKKPNECMFAISVSEHSNSMVCKLSEEMVPCSSTGTLSRAFETCSLYFGHECKKLVLEGRDDMWR